MKLILAAAATTMAISAPAFAQDRDRDAEYEQEFEELIEGRVAGEATPCITTFRGNDLEVVEHVGLTYERGDTLWVARVNNPRDLGPWDVPIIRRYGSQLCRHDVNQTIDRSTGIFTGVIFFSEWVPYTEVDEAEAET